jgi:hypothetical protein
MRRTLVGATATMVVLGSLLVVGAVLPADGQVPPTVDVVLADGIDACAGRPPGPVMFAEHAFALTRSDTTGPLEVTVTYGGTATPGVDYESLPTTATFADGQAATGVGPIVVLPAATEGESVVLEIVAGPGYLVDPNAATALSSFIAGSCPADQPMPLVPLPEGDGTVLARTG